MALYYSKDHEWLRLEGEVATIGITEHAQEQLGDVVFVELPEIGASFAKGDEAAVVESVKAASELYAPVSGEIVEANTALADQPNMVNDDAEGAAWFFKMKLKDKAELDQLMDRDAYDSFVASLD